MVPDGRVQESLIASFLQVTNIEDVGQAREWLQRYDFDVERAIAAFFDGEGVLPNEDQVPHNVVLDETNTSVNTPIGTATQGLPHRWIGWSYWPSRVLLLPVASIFRLLRGVSLALSVILVPISRILVSMIPGSKRTYNRATLSPESLVMQFKSDFEQTYGSEHVPFVSTGFNESRETAKKEVRMLLILLQSSQHDDSDQFNKVLCDTNLINIIQQHNIIVWPGDTINSEAFQIAEILQCTNLPFASLLAPTGRSRGGMSVLGRWNGGELLSADIFCRNLNESIARGATAIRRLELERDQRNQSQQLRESQEAAYLRSLELDRARVQNRERERQEEIARRAREERIHRESEQRQENRLEYLSWRKSTLYDGPFVAGKTARISIRFPDGSRKIQVFRDNDTIEHIYAFVDCELAGANLKQCSEPPKNYNHTYNFKMYTVMPRRLLAAASGTSIRDESTLWPNGQIAVETDEDEDEENVE